ncbi:MAG: helix-turn-helix domain-containing protein [Candidatus Thorarchaeota archaeon]|nr:helix-turn-helix domain-containing protein [Candidatus Thorarchaeota archaeon]
MERLSATDLDRVFKALGHVTRRRILQLLSQSPRYPYELSKILNVNRRVILKHLEALEDAGLVEHESGSSELGPDRTYYRLSVSFGLSTTILPNSFLIRVTRPSLSSLKESPPQTRADVQAVRKLLGELNKVNQRLEEIDRERVRLAQLRGQIIHQIEEIMQRCDWDEESCARVRSLIDPSRVEMEQAAFSSVDSWNKIMREVLRLFEEFFGPE